MRRFKRRSWKEVIGLLVLFSFILSITYIVFRIITAPTEITNLEEPIRVKSDYVLMLVQCIVGLLAMQIPNIISKKMNLEIPSNMYLAFVLFLYCAIFLGEVRNFYYKIPHWDVILHAFSGFMLGSLGFSIIAIMNKEEKVKVNLSPIFVAIFAFTFAVTMGVLWEIYEFSFDGLLGLNMQKYALENGVQLIGRSALMDTMKDLIVDCIGATIMCSIGYVSLKYNKNWLDEVTVRPNK